MNRCVLAHTIFKVFNPPAKNKSGTRWTFVKKVNELMIDFL